jgi:hypothetical protein
MPTQSEVVSEAAFTEKQFCTAEAHAALVAIFAVNLRRDDCLATPPTWMK